VARLPNIFEYGRGVLIMDHEPMYDKEQNWLGQSQDNMSGWNCISTMSIVFFIELIQDKIKETKYRHHKNNHLVLIKMHL
jgi:hypothetical protein